MRVGPLARWRGRAQGLSTRMQHASGRYDGRVRGAGACTAGVLMVYSEVLVFPACVSRLRLTVFRVRLIRAAPEGVTLNTFSGTARARRAANTGLCRRWIQVGKIIETEHIISIPTVHGSDWLMYYLGRAVKGVPRIQGGADIGQKSFIDLRLHSPHAAYDLRDARLNTCRLPVCRHIVGYLNPFASSIIYGKFCFGHSTTSSIRRRRPGVHATYSVESLGLNAYGTRKPVVQNLFTKCMLNLSRVIINGMAICNLMFIANYKQDQKISLVIKTIFCAWLSRTQNIVSILQTSNTKYKIIF